MIQACAATAGRGNTPASDEEAIERTRSPSLSDTALALSRSMLSSVDIHCDSYVFDDVSLDELSEFCLRVLHSFLADPEPTPARRRPSRAS